MAKGRPFARNKLINTIPSVGFCRKPRPSEFIDSNNYQTELFHFNYFLQHARQRNFGINNFCPTICVILLTWTRCAKF